MAEEMPPFADAGVAVAELEITPPQAEDTATSAHARAINRVRRKVMREENGGFLAFLLFGGIKQLQCRNYSSQKTNYLTSGKIIPLS